MSSELTDEQRRRIQENRQRALALKASREASSKSLQPPAKVFRPDSGPARSSSSTLPVGEAKTSVFSSPVATSKENVPFGTPRHHVQQQQKPAVALIFTDKPVLGKSILMSRTSFCVEIAFHAKVIEVFKSIPSKHYDMASKLWSFAVTDHALLMSKLDQLRPQVSVAPLPKYIVERLLRSPNKSEIKYDNLNRVEPYLVSNLMPFQKDGVCFGISKGGRVLIADDMGLGKTIQALGIASHYAEEWPLIIVAPSSMKYNWARDVSRWLPSVLPSEVCVVDTGKKTSLVDFRVYVVSYDLFARRVDEFCKLQKPIGVAIMDEAHMLKNGKTVRAKAAVKLLKSVRRTILLSGTPALSRPIELFTQLKILDPRTFGNYVEFGLRYCNGKTNAFGYDFAGSSHMTELQIAMEETVMIRRLKTEVLDQLPAKERQVILLDPATIDKPSKDMKSLASQMMNSTLKGMERRGKLLEYFHETGQAKLRAVCDYVVDLYESDNKFLCFAHHSSVLDGIADALQKRKVEYIRIDGRTSSEARRILCEKFQHRDDVRVALLSITAANAGITLTRANIVVFAELYWNPGILTQAEDRAHRIGQQDCVFVQYLVAAGTADDYLWPMIQGKLDVLNKAGLSKDNFSNADLISAPKKEQKNIKEFFETLVEDLNTQPDSCDSGK